jgi:hypothetical protein
MPLEAISRPGVDVREDRPITQGAAHGHGGGYVKKIICSLSVNS